MLADAHVIVIEGSHGTGKTTLSYAVAAALASAGHPVRLVGEVVRASPWFQDALLRGDGTVDELAFVHLFADQLRQELEAGRHATYAVLDRSVLSCLGYWRLRTRGEVSPAMVQAVEAVAREHCVCYDLIVYCHDRYPLARHGDPFRSTDEDFRTMSHEAIHSVVDRIGGRRAKSLPVGLAVPDKVRWVLDQLDTAST